MPSTLVKGGIVVTGIGGAGLGGWAVSSYIKSKNDTVKVALLSKKYKLTSSLSSTEQKEAWKKVLETYKLEAKGDLKIKSEEITNANEIKTWCSTNVEKSYEESIFRKAKKWCVIYSTFKDKLKEEKLEIETELSAFKTKYSSLGNLKGEIDKIALATSNNDGNDNGRKLQKWCESKIYLSHDGESSSSYESFKNHCKKVST